MTVIETGTVPPSPVRIFGSPGRYVQGDGVIDLAGEQLVALGLGRCAVLLSERSQKAEGQRLLQSLTAAGISAEVVTFGGECSFEEIERHVGALGRLDQPMTALIALGGGKVVDAGKSIAHRLDVPVIIVPSLASNDAPCSSASVIYTVDGITEDFEIFKANPILVLVDTGIVAQASERYLVAGMGDGMATWYEARMCRQNPQASNVFGARPTLAGGAISELCASTIYADGLEAAAAVRENRVTEALDRVVEANTLLSGLGFECGGLAAAHSVAQGYTVIERVHKKYLHGEMVAMGTLAQLALEGWRSEAEKATRFFVEVGLPVHLGQLSLSAEDTGELAPVVEAALAFPFMANMSQDVSQESLLSALLAADELGRDMVAKMGDNAYRTMHE